MIGPRRKHGYDLVCVGGPFDGRVVNYPDWPPILVLVTDPFRYHDYRRVGETNVYRYVERTGQWPPSS